jgi:hypothetical protein
MQTIEQLKQIDRSNWITLLNNSERFAAWQSSEFTVQAFHVPGDIIRLSVNRNELAGTQRLYLDGINWDELQQIKEICGYGDRMAVEIYPENYHVLNIINARHLWILPDPMPFAWRNP